MCYTDWLMRGSFKKLVLAIKGLESELTLERWVFDCECISPPAATKPSFSNVVIKDVTQEISAIIRQITSSMTFLPALTEPCSLDILVYTESEPSTDVPPAWSVSDPSYVHNSEEFRMRSFSNNVHHLDVKVSYKTNDS
jgi:mitotic spindle assembly checkpoint protein MAD2